MRGCGVLIFGISLLRESELIKLNNTIEDALITINSHLSCYKCVKIDLQLIRGFLKQCFRFLLKKNINKKNVFWLTDTCRKDKIRTFQKIWNIKTESQNDDNVL